MKIVMISQMVPYLPCYDGFRLIPANFLRLLSERHEYHLFAFTDGEDTEDQLHWARRYCATVTHIKPPVQRGILARATRLFEPFSFSGEAVAKFQAIDPDILHLEGPHLAPLVQHAPDGCATMISAHDSLSLRFSQFGGFADSARDKLRFRLLGAVGKRMERRWYARADRVVVTSQVDAEWLRRLVPSAHIVAIPNGVEFEEREAERIAGRIVFTGNMSWFPNEDAAEYFSQQVFPLVRKEVPNAEFWIVGSSPSQRVRELGKMDGVTAPARWVVWPIS